MLNERHLYWCQQHDWGTDAILENGTIKNLMDHRYDAITGYRYFERTSFDNIQALRSWAGY